MSKEKFTVSWIMPGEPLLKFKEPDKTYDIAEDVYKFIKDNKLDTREDEFLVEAEIDESKGENGTVIFLKEVNSSTKSTDSKDEGKSDTTKSETENLNVLELTVNGVSLEKRAVKFKEDKDNDTWYTLDDSIDAQEFKDKYTRKTIEISVEAVENGNDIIKAFTAKEEDTSKETAKDQSSTQNKKKYNNNDTQVSIEAQASVNSANRVVSKMSEIHKDPKKVLTTIETIAEHNFELIQKLKKKE